MSDLQSTPAGGNRPEWLTCIRHGRAAGDGYWCGRTPGPMEFAFKSIDHAAYNGLRGGRLVPCPACLAAVARALGLPVPSAAAAPDAPPRPPAAL